MPGFLALAEKLRVTEGTAMKRMVLTDYIGRRCIFLLNLFYLTNDPDVAIIAENNGVDRIWIDLETLGKEERQKGLNTVKSKHAIADISIVKTALKKSELLVRINPWNENSPSEVDRVIDAGADIVMLPMWKSTEEVEAFLSTVGRRVNTMLLLETKEAVGCIDRVLSLDFDEIHIGLNDLHLSYGMGFLFEPLSNGLVDTLCAKFKKRGIPYGFGGIARLGEGMIPAEMIIQEHYRLGSTRAILSRSFCDASVMRDISSINELFCENIRKIRKYEEMCLKLSQYQLAENHLEVVHRVNGVLEEKRKSRCVEKIEKEILPNGD